MRRLLWWLAEWAAHVVVKEGEWWLRREENRWYRIAWRRKSGGTV